MNLKNRLKAVFFVFVIQSDNDTMSFKSQYMERIDQSIEPISHAETVKNEIWLRATQILPILDMHLAAEIRIEGEHTVVLEITKNDDPEFKIEMEFNEFDEHTTLEEDIEQLYRGTFEKKAQD